MGHIPVNIDGIDLMAAPGHKGLLGPMGTGFLYVDKNVKLQPIMQGGTGTYSKMLEPPMEFPESFEAGTVNAPGIIGLRHSLKYMRNNYFDDHLIYELDQYLRNMEKVRVYGPESWDKKVGIVTFNIDGWDSRDVASLLNDNYGIATRAGFHCSGLAHETIGTSATGCVRITPGFYTQQKEIKAVIEAVKEIAGNKK
jgi:selenocysteine lyase/cysteine desulfurase